MKKYGLPILLAAVLCLICFPAQVKADPKDEAKSEAHPQIEVFDIEKGEVIDRIENTEAIQDEMNRCLASLDDLNSDFYFEPQDGVMLSIPITPTKKINSSWVTHQVSEVQLIISPKEKPRLLLYSDQGDPFYVQVGDDLVSLVLQVLSHSGYRPVFLEGA